MSRPLQPRPLELDSIRALSAGPPSSQERDSDGAESKPSEESKDAASPFEAWVIKHFGKHKIIAPDGFNRW